MRPPLALIVEGFSEFDSYPSILSKILAGYYFPISNAKGIGNITKNIEKELLLVVKTQQPLKIIVTLDYREAERQGLVANCIELKELVSQKCQDFLAQQQAIGSLVLPNEIVVVVVDRTFETWLCADLEALSSNGLIEPGSITENFKNVDTELPNPSNWLSGKLRDNIDWKANTHRKNIACGLRPEIAQLYSRSFRKFYEEVQKTQSIIDAVI